MKRRRVVVLAAATVAALAAVAAVLLVGRVEAEAFRGSSPPPGLTLPGFALPDSSGERLSSEELRGKIVIVTFLDTQCTESCPIIAAQIGRALDLLNTDERGRVVAVAFSTDPDEDTPASVHDFLRRHRVEGRLHYLVAPVDELRPLWTAFQISPSHDTGQDSLHSAPVRIYSADGIWISTLHVGADLTPENLAHDLRVAIER